MSKQKSIVVLSGGQDSVTTFYSALQNSQVVGAVHFDYGQKHAIERECALYHCQKAGVELRTLSIPAFAEIGDSALLIGGGDVNEPHPTLKDLPASFVPGRNIVFLTFAAGLAMKLGATELWTGVCQEDYSGYPDCRRTVIDELELTLQIGMRFRELHIETPLMYLSKAETFHMAKRLGVLDEVIEHTHTCYNGDHSTRNSWGYGCGACPSCEVRKNGWEKFQSGRR